MHMSNNGHMDENRILHHLLQEVQSSNGFIEGDSQAEVNNNKEVYNMIENYRNHVKQQKKLSNGSGKNFTTKQLNRTFHPLKIEKRGNAQSNSSTTMSHSQPCLYSVGDRRTENPTKKDFLHHAYSSDPRKDSINDNNSMATYNKDEVPNRKPEDSEQLQSEVIFLRRQIQSLEQKTSKLKQLELAYSRIEQEFEQIISQREKHEQLEKAALLKLEQETHHLSQQNQLLQKENDKLNQLLREQPSQQQRTNDLSLREPHDSQQCENINDTNQAQQIVKMNMLLNDLVPKNKELLAIEERQRIELDAQRTTLEEQRTHIDMLEKALSNAQERLAAKDRQAIDAIAVMDKCAHLQKLLQESLDEKQKRQNEYTRQKSQLEMELTQLRLQISKDTSTSGIHKSNKSPENEEIIKLKKTIYEKEERISQLENNLLNIQRRFNGELQRNNVETIETLREKIRNLETENLEKERRIQELLDEKHKIHGQWAEERRSLDHRVRLLEQDLRVLMLGSNGALSNFSSTVDCGVRSSAMNHLHGTGDYHNHTVFSTSPFYNDVSNVNSCSGYSASFKTYSRSNSSCGDASPLDADTCTTPTTMRYMYGNTFDNADVHSRDFANDLSANIRSALIHDNTMTRMEELRRKIADRRASVTSSGSSVSTVGIRTSSKDVASDENNYKSKNGSSLSLCNSGHNHVITTDSSMHTPYYVSYDSAGQHRFGLRSSSSRMSSHMPENITNNIDSLPLSTRRRFVASEKATLRNNSSSPNTTAENRHSGASLPNECDYTCMKDRNSALALISINDVEATNEQWQHNASNIPDVKTIGAYSTAKSIYQNNNEVNQSPDRLVFARKNVQKPANSSDVGTIVQLADSAVNEKK